MSTRNRLICSRKTSIGPIVGALAEWARWLCEDQGFQLDQNTVVVVDIDKTALGARGRNDKAIDAARVEGAYRTLSKALGANADLDDFVVDYDELNQAKYHGVTADNQDYLVYLCLVFSSGLIYFRRNQAEVADGSLTSFEQFTRRSRRACSSTRRERRVATGARRRDRQHAQRRPHPLQKLSTPRIHFHR